MAELPNPNPQGAAAWMNQPRDAMGRFTKANDTDKKQLDEQVVGNTVLNAMSTSLMTLTNTFTEYFQSWKKSLDDAARARAEARLEQQKGGGSGTTTEKKFDWKGLSGDMGFEWILGIGLVAALTDLDELWRALSMGISSITKVIGGFWKDLKLLGTQMFGKDSFFSRIISFIGRFTSEFQEKIAK